MQRLTKKNAREVFLKFCDQFQKVTGESLGVTFTWDGSLDIFGSNTFREIIQERKDKIGRSLVLQTNDKTNKRLLDMEMFQILKGDISKCTTEKLRRLISWAVQKSTGRRANIWTSSSPSWWPNNIPYVCISKKTKKHSMTKDKLQNIAAAYKQDLGYNDSIDEHITSTPKKCEKIPTSSSTIPQNTLLDESNSNSCFFDIHNLEPTHPIPSVLSANLQPNVRNNVLTASTIQICMKELSDSQMLTDIVIHSYCKLLKRSYLNLNGLQDTIFSQKRGFKNMMNGELSIQIHYNGERHWVCSSYDPINSQVILYDSVYQNKTTMELDTQLAQIYGSDSMQLVVTIPRIQLQNGGNDCGLFALATATCIAAKIDPVSQAWNQHEMRAHCMQCLKLEKISFFPAKTRGIRNGKFPKPYVFAIDLICDCQLPDYAYDIAGESDASRSVQCDNCTFWFHNRCYSLPNESIKGEFWCKSCMKL